MFALLSALALAGSPAPAPLHQAAQEEVKEDRVICKGNRSSRSLGSNVARGRLCLPESEWKLVEKQSRRELDSARQKMKDPTRLPGR